MSKIYVDEIAGIASPSTVAIPGHVIQVVKSSLFTQGSTTSTSGVDIGLSASITPSSTANKILVLVAGGTSYSSAPSNGGPSFWLADGNSTIISEFGLHSGGFGTTATSFFPMASCSVLHSPNTTSSFTYKVRAKTYNASTQTGWCWNGTETTITLMEIAG